MIMNYSTYYRPRPPRRESGPMDFLMPFFIFICIGIIGVLVYNLWAAVYDTSPDKEAVFNIIEGDAQMRTWGTDQFFGIDSGAYLIEGDEIKMSSNGKAVIEFFDGTLLRLGGDSNLILEEISHVDMGSQITVELKSGRAWFNKVYKNSSSNLIVKSKYLTVNAPGKSIFTVLEAPLSVMVMSGEQVSVDVYNRTRETIVQTENIGLGQGIEFTETVLAKYWNYQSPNVLSALSDSFKASDWYVWNLSEDERPQDVNSDFDVSDNGLLPVEPELFDEEEIVEDEESDDEDIEELEEEEEDTEELEEEEEDTEELEEEEEDTEELEEELVSDFELSSPDLSEVLGASGQNDDGFYLVSGHLATIKGTSNGASKIMVNDYTLQKFSPGDTNWVYYANADYDLMKEGENIYEIYALDADGNKSDPLIVKILYEPEVEATEETVEEESESTEPADFEEPADAPSSTPPDWLL
ncbi:hypothetical protein GF354_00680 [Candidatus Peregrinibacteria bacterium]|nr:hypothetical protein [Candidatus Peregrinibacteria bacterium]